MKVELTDAAKSDLREIRIWIATDNPRAADRVLNQLRGATQSLSTMWARHPFAGPPGLRRVVQGSYLIFYRVTDKIEVVGFIHSARDWPNLLDDPA